jgi:hypothetical protein
MTDSTVIAIFLFFILPLTIPILLGIVGARHRARTRKFYSLCRAIGSASKLTGEVYYATVFLHRRGIDSPRASPLSSEEIGKDLPGAGNPLPIQIPR